MNIPNFSTRIVSSLEKALITDRPEQHQVLERQSVLIGEKLDFQLLILDEDPEIASTRNLKAEVTGLPCDVTCRAAVSVYADMPTYSHDTSRGTLYYIESKSGTYPDVLEPLDSGKYFRPLRGRTSSLWFTCVPRKAGIYTVTVTLKEADRPVSENTFLLTVIAAELPEQELIFTEWFHCDCLSTYYHVPVFSPEHWKIISSYMKCASENGVNCLLTPIFTPPLDTEIGGERPTVQLVGVKADNNGYTFDFSLLNVWFELARKNGIKYFEISHFFSQWGAEFAPKIIAEKDGKPCRIFGWNTPGTEGEYPRFLSCFLPELIAFLREQGVLESCIFHISDEPNETQLEGYMKAKKIVSPYLEGCTIADALSSVAFYKSGAVNTPIPATNHIEPFLEEPISQRWAYYCCGQWDKVGNRFIAYPSARNRILGVQLYKFGIKGFLHWGFNYWYSMGSRRLINPYLCQSGEGQVPSGDAFSVYPAQDGTPYESIRLNVFREAIQDISVLSLCEKFIGRARVTALIDTLAGDKLTFSSYPADPEYILRLREEINRIIAENVQA